MTHENLKATYEEDAKRTEKPYLLWQVRVGGVWKNLPNHPAWAPNLHYRRHPNADKVLEVTINADNSTTVKEHKPHDLSIN